MRGALHASGMNRLPKSRRLISARATSSGRRTCFRSKGRRGRGSCTRITLWICWSSGSPAWTMARWSSRARKSKGARSEARGVLQGDCQAADAAAMTALLLAVIALMAISLGGLVIFTAVTARRVEAALPPRGRFIEIAGARIHYLDKGSGPAIVILHGLGDGASDGAGGSGGGVYPQVGAGVAATGWAFAGRRDCAGCGARSSRGYKRTGVDCAAYACPEKCAGAIPGIGH